MNRLTKVIIAALVALMLVRFLPGLWMLMAVLLRVALSALIILGVLALPLAIMLGAGAVSFKSAKKSHRQSRKTKAKKPVSPKGNIDSDEPIEEAQIVDTKK